MTSNSSSSLDTMPKLVIEKIIAKSCWKSVLTLRKVCHRLRCQVDNVPEDLLPDAQMTEISIVADDHQIRVELESLDETHRILYDITKYDSESGCMLDMVVKDIGQVLRFQKSPLKNFDVYITLASTSKKVLSSQNQFIKTESLRILSYESDQILFLLSLVDPAILKSIDITNRDLSLPDFKPTEIVDTPQWTNAKAVLTNINVPVQHLTHFSSVSIRGRRTFSVDDINFLKIEYANSPSFVSFKAPDSIITDAKRLQMLWRWPPVEHQGRKCWYFKMYPTTDEILLISLDSSFFTHKSTWDMSPGIEFSRIKPDQVPRLHYLKR